MTDSTKLARAIARHREVEGKATKGPWATMEREGINDLWACEDYVFDPQGEARSRKAQDNLAEAALARGSHAALLDIAEAAIELRTAHVGTSKPLSGCSECAAIKRLDAALTRLTEGK